MRRAKRAEREISLGKRAKRAEREISLGKRAKRAEREISLGRLAAALATLLTIVAVGRTARPLVAESERFTGAELPAKRLVFTFDQGPSPTTEALALELDARGIKATFFVDDRYDTPDGKAILTELAASGHLLGNRASTNRDLVTEVPLAEVEAELAATDTLLAPFVPWNRKVFRAPFGSWTGSGADGGDPDAVYNRLKTTALNDHVGPIYWNIDADCTGLTDTACTDAYLQRIRARASGIVRFDDTAQTYEVIKALVPLLVADGYGFDALDTVPSLASQFGKCDSTCSGCTGPAPDDCNACPAGARLFLGQCLACAVCQPGFYAVKGCVVEADTLCSPCGANTYQPAPGSGSCLVCGNCADDDPCTTDTCHPVNGCTHTKIADCPKVIEPPEYDAGPSRFDAGRVPGTRIDDENNIAVSVEDESGCTVGRTRSSSRTPAIAGLVVAFCIARRLRRRA